MIHANDTWCRHADLHSYLIHTIPLHTKKHMKTHPNTHRNVHTDTHRQTFMHWQCQHRHILLFPTQTPTYPKRLWKHPAQELLWLSVQTFRDVVQLDNICRWTSQWGEPWQILTDTDTEKPPKASKHPSQAPEPPNMFFPSPSIPGYCCSVSSALWLALPQEE